MTQKSNIGYRWVSFGHFWVEASLGKLKNRKIYLSQKVLTSDESKSGVRTLNAKGGDQTSGPRGLNPFKSKKIRLGF